MLLNIGYLWVTGLCMCGDDYKVMHNLLFCWLIGGGGGGRSVVIREKMDNKSQYQYSKTRSKHKRFKRMLESGKAKQVHIFRVTPFSSNRQIMHLFFFLFFLMMSREIDLL